MRIKFLYVNHAFKEINIKKTSIKKRAIELFGVVHFDICGPLQTWTHLGYIYFITFIDDLSKCCYVYPIRHNTRAFDKFPYYKNFVESKQIISLRFYDLTVEESINLMSSIPFVNKKVFKENLHVLIHLNKMVY